MEKLGSISLDLKNNTDEAKVIRKYVFGRKMPSDILNFMEDANTFPPHIIFQVSENVRISKELSQKLIPNQKISKIDDVDCAKHLRLIHPL